MCRKEFPGHSLCRHMYVPEGMSSVVWVYTFGSALFFLHVRVCTFVSARLFLHVRSCTFGPAACTLYQWEAARWHRICAFQGRGEKSCGCGEMKKKQRVQHSWYLSHPSVEYFFQTADFFTFFWKILQSMALGGADGDRSKEEEEKVKVWVSKFFR